MLFRSDATVGGETVDAADGLLFAVVLPLCKRGDSDSSLSLRTEGWDG